MDFKTFAVSMTNIFPCANSSASGQLFTEYNIRSRESIATDSRVKYFIGPSYTHSPDCFSLSVQQDSAGQTVSASSLQIASGRCLLNGHYIETLAPMVIDLLAANVELKKNGREPLKGRLAVGLRVMYSGEALMAGAMLPENNDTLVYEGVKVVILPEKELITPSDSPDDISKVTAHLKLGTFNFINGNISSITQNIPGKYQTLPAERISNVDQLISASYVGKSGLNPGKLYTFAGKGTTESDKDTWCDSTDALMIWDRTPEVTTEAPAVREAKFTTSYKGNIVLQIPHKQVDGYANQSGQPLYYKDKNLDIPVADYAKGTSGTVDNAYTNKIKDIQSKIDNFHFIAKGKQVGYLASRNWTDSGDPEPLPAINPKWSVGDYILVNEDNTASSSSSGTRAPSTCYVVLPGYVNSIQFVEKSADSTTIPTSIKGICLLRTEVTEDPSNTTIEDIQDMFNIPGSVRGRVNEDYYLIEYHYQVDKDDGTSETKTTRFYYKVSSAGDFGYSEAVWLTGEIPLAQETSIGGFLNVPDTTTDAGYVIRDEEGHLRLIDYALLRSGTLAYQLGEDYEVPKGYTIAEIQSHLNDYVNNRVAFRDIKTLQNTDINVNMINVTIHLPEDSEEESTVILRGIDSRFNTAVNLKIRGDAGRKTTVYIMDCEKIKIDSNIGGAPNIVLVDCNLYYDPYVLDEIRTISGLSLWYQKFDSNDADLLVNNMTVTDNSRQISADEVDVWSEDVPNDNHYSYALKSLTFGKDGTIVGCQLLMRNQTTANVEENKYILVQDWELPTGVGLSYPSSKLTKQLKITGSFVTAYPVSNPNGYKVAETQFTALTQAIDAVAIANGTSGMKGTISILTNVSFVDSVIGVDPGTTIDGFANNAFYAFNGTAIN